MTKILEWLGWATPRGKTVTTNRLVTRLTPDVFNQLTREVNGSTFVTASTTELQAGFMLGVVHVLNAIQKGIVIETSPTSTI